MFPQQKTFHQRGSFLFPRGKRFATAFRYTIVSKNRQKKRSFGRVGKIAHAFICAFQRTFEKTTSMAWKESTKTYAYLKLNRQIVVPFFSKRTVVKIVDLLWFSSQLDERQKRQVETPNLQKLYYFLHAQKKVLQKKERVQQDRHIFKNFLVPAKLFYDFFHNF